MVPAYTGAGLVPVLQRRGSRSAGWVMGSAELFERAGMGDVFCGGQTRWQWVLARWIRRVSKHQDLQGKSLHFNAMPMDRLKKTSTQTLYHASNKETTSLGVRGSNHSRPSNTLLVRWEAVPARVLIAASILILVNPPGRGLILLRWIHTSIVSPRLWMGNWKDTISISTDELRHAPV
jgi:hypothetical protein